MTLECTGTLQWMPLLAAAIFVAAWPAAPVRANVSLVSFRAEARTDRVELLWESATELDTVGYQLRRGARQEGPFQALPGAFIPARAIQYMPRNQRQIAQSDLRRDRRD